MAEHNILGQKGEEAACAFLVKKGYEILETNWRWRKWEIDLIALKDEQVIVAEVKTRRTNYFGEPEEFVSRKQQRNLVQAANAYIESKGRDEEVRFDIISILYNNKTYKIHHIEDAFFPLV